MRPTLSAVADRTHGRLAAAIRRRPRVSGGSTPELRSATRDARVNPDGRRCARPSARRWRTIRVPASPSPSTWEMPTTSTPPNKQDVGKRLARAARQVIYGESIAPSGPVPRGATRSAAQIVVEFGDIDGGLVAYSHDSPIGFELCASLAGTCQYAEARIQNAQVRITVPNGTTPSACATVGPTVRCVPCSTVRVCPRVRLSLKSAPEGLQLPIDPIAY